MLYKFSINIFSMKSTSYFKRSYMYLISCIKIELIFHPNNISVNKTKTQLADHSSQSILALQKEEYNINNIFFTNYHLLSFL